MAARHYELIYLHRLIVAARHTSKKAESKQKLRMKKIAKKVFVRIRFGNKYARFIS